VMAQWLGLSANPSMERMSDKLQFVVVAEQSSFCGSDKLKFVGHLFVECLLEMDVNRS